MTPEKSTLYQKTSIEYKRPYHRTEDDKSDNKGDIKPATDPTNQDIKKNKDDKDVVHQGEQGIWFSCIRSWGM